MSEPTKAEQMKVLIDKLRETMQLVAGGQDPRVQVILKQMELVLTPNQGSS